jgi:hypothetical protein
MAGQQQLQQQGQAARVRLPDERPWVLLHLQLSTRGWQARGCVRGRTRRAASGAAGRERRAGGSASVRRRLVSCLPRRSWTRFAPCLTEPLNSLALRLALLCQPPWASAPSGRRAGIAAGGLARGQRGSVAARSRLGSGHLLVRTTSAAGLSHEASHTCTDQTMREAASQ